MTRDLGLIRASAIGVRKEASKLRGGLEPYILSSVSLVRGRDYWKATSAESIKSIPAKSALARPFSLLEQLIQGEDPHPELFDVIEQFASAEINEDEELFEIRLVAQILYYLGYLKETDFNLDKKELIKVINDGIAASHL
jgi:recombinational DNA repair protein (RecF pathway)